MARDENAKFTLHITVTENKTGKETDSKTLVYPDSESADYAAQAAFDAAVESEEDDVDR